MLKGKWEEATWFIRNTKINISTSSINTECISIEALY